MRKHGKGPLITQVDCWSNLVFATTDNTVIIYLLDEEDRENNDIPLEKIVMESQIAMIHLIEMEWNVCKLTVISKNSAVYQYLVKQNDV